MYMRHLMSGIFALSLMTGLSSYCRADEQKSDTPAPAASAPESTGSAQTAEKPAPKTDKEADTAKKVANEPAASGPNEKAKAHLDNFKQKHAGNPYTDKVTVAAQDLAKTLNDDQAHAFAQIRDGSSMLRAVRITVNEVGSAATMCGAKNADLKKPMDERFGGWKRDVDAAIEKNTKAMDAGIKSGVAGDPEKVRSYLKLLDDWSAYDESKIEKKPVTTESACKTLYSTMGKSGPAIVTQLESVKWPEPASEKAKEGSVNTPGKAGGKQPDQTEPAAGKAH
ncbi:MAG TPA: hypothetical protein VL625_13050 [Patescibacteria group bacterium]|jgi:hypothetical protein|nr:hypothetical protein [Patescibacteria group bacterium]